MSNLLMVVSVFGGIGMYFLIGLLLIRGICPTCKHFSLFNKKINSFAISGCANGNIIKCKKCGNDWTNIIE